MIAHMIADLTTPLVSEELVSDSIVNLSDPVFIKLGQLGLVAAVVTIIARLLAKTTSKIVEDNSSQYQLRKTISYIGFGVVALAAIGIFGRSIVGFGVALGVVGAGVAFALQEVIASIAGWVAITVGKFYRPGDRIQLGGITGDVIDVGVLRTTIMETGGWVEGDLYNGRIARVANSFAFKSPVYNYSGEFPFLWDEIVVAVKHSSDHVMARQLLVDACHETIEELSGDVRGRWDKLRSRYRLEDANLKPMVTMIFNDNWTEFTVRYVVDYKSRRTTKDKLFTSILEKVDTAGDGVELASTTLEITHHRAKRKG